MTDLAGRRLQNRYRVDSFIGHGGMADVYQVWDLNRSVYLAMKVLHSDLAEDRAFLRRFKREAETLSQLQHPHIVRSYGLETDGRIAFILMDYIEGINLRTRIFDLNRPFTVEEVLEIMQPVCAALHYAHQSSIVHCDVKPANIMIHKNGTVLVSDFGISRLTETATTTMVGAGTPAYMSPEQARSEDLTPQSDLYSLGIVLYEMLTGGERPFTGEKAQVTGGTSEKVRWEQINIQPPSPHFINPGIIPATEAVVLKCLHKDPTQRYPSVIDMLNALVKTDGGVRQVVAIPNRLSMDQMNSIPGPSALVLAKKDAVSNKPVKDGSLTIKHGEIPYLASAAVMLFVLILVLMGRSTSPILGLIATPSLPTTAVNTMTDEPTLVYFIETATPISTPTLVPTETPTPVPVLGSTRLREKDSMVMVYVPAGPFIMGSDNGNNAEKPAHTVSLGSYWIDQTEVTNGMYALCVQNGGCLPPTNDSSGTRDHYYNHPDFVDYPVINVDWSQANTYCAWAGGRLPTEAEWEKAARGEDARAYPWGEGIRQNSANYNFYVGDTTRAGSYENGKSPYGAFDMAGNVWEWVADWYDVYPGGDKSASTDFGTSYRVMRGGSWVNEGDDLRASVRGRYGPGGHTNRYGFRCVRSQ